ncbi:MAG TPA: hypothetical protein VEG60_11005, partial [Candidatus Binatia bacterium]|nr:hypothetical protein [Candidatus Binatia bacterium]
MKAAKAVVATWIFWVSITAGSLLQSAESGFDQKPVKETESFEVAFKEFKLKNGLRVILAEDHSAPTYSICVTYNVGSRDERPGRTG